MECKRTNPQSSLPTPPSRTHTYTNTILMDSWSISNPTGHPVRSQALSGIHPQSHWFPCAFIRMQLQTHLDLYAFTGMHPQTNPQSRCPTQPFPLILGSKMIMIVIILHILQEIARLSVCARQVRGSILQKFCRLVTYRVIPAHRNYVFDPASVFLSTH